MKKATRIAILSAIFVTPVLAAPTMYDLTSIGSSADINGGHFITTDQRSTGTGVIQSFVRISANTDMEQGYNTDARPLEYDENNSPNFTRSLPLDVVPIVNVDGTLYREFLLDINQSKNAPGYYLSLDKLQISLHQDPALSDASVIFASPLYDLDGAGDSRIVLDYRHNAGSGSGDMAAYIPITVFTAAKPGDNVYLYSMFGQLYDDYNLLDKKDYKDWDDYVVSSEDYYPNNAGFEEWAVQTGYILPAVPVPGAILLSGLGAGIVASVRRRKSL